MSHGPRQPGGERQRNLVAEASRETGTTAGQVLDASSDLSQQATRLNGEIDSFLKKLGLAA